VNTKVFVSFDAAELLVQWLLWLLLEFWSLRMVLLFARILFVWLMQAVWRFVLALGVVYQMLLVLILFQTKSDARALFKFIDPTLGVKLPEKSYAESCDFFSYKNWADQMDVFVLAHVFGWVAKALILRDAWLCWIISVLFEVMEYSLQHQLPNFAECWWDHWILDVFTANWLGIYVGMKLCDYFAFKVCSFKVDIFLERNRSNSNLQGQT
jgi:phosphatidylserine synthase 2